MTGNKTVAAEVHARALERIAELERELADCRTSTEPDAGIAALEREQATAEVLRVISRSPESLDSSLRAVAETAARLCRANYARVFLRDNDYLVLGPSAPPRDPNDPFQPGNRLGPISDPHAGPSPQAARTGRTVHTDDLLRFVEERGRQLPERQAEIIRRTGPRAVLSVPLLRGSNVVGVLTLSREGEAQPFSEREVALAESFADQAAIAVENARLFQGIQERNRDLSEALEQQTALGEILAILSRSPADLPNVLQAVVERSVRLTGA
ncbi:MAG: GAF domain-containing protein, partial [Dehalococcoidia bacterium]